MRPGKQERPKKKEKKLRRAAAAASSMAGLLLLLGVIVLCGPLAAPRLFGYAAYAVTSGSMEPGIPVGSLVYAQEADPVGLEAGDVIVFYGGTDMDTISPTPGTETTHRIVRNDRDRREFTTKGDANAGEDMLPVPYGALIGKVACHFPYLGNVLPLVSGEGAKRRLLCLVAGGLLLRIVGGLLRGE